MQLTPVALLDLWERAMGKSPIERPAVLATHAGEPGAGATLPLGQRDAMVLRAHRALMGDQLLCIIPCQACRAELELSLSISAILDVEDYASTASHEVNAAGHLVRFRPICQADLEAVDRQQLRGEEFQAALLAACIISAEGPDGALDTATLPQAVINAVARELERIDPLSVVWVDLCCAECGANWQTVLDPPALFWNDLQRAARRLMLEVRSLAQSYGWSEAEILAMSDARRRIYLEIA